MEKKRPPMLSAVCLILMAIAIAGAVESKDSNIGDWVNISDQQPPELQHSQGIAVDPTTGNLYLYTYAPARANKESLHISKDHGVTWSSIPCPATGGGFNGFSINIAYPFTGRMALFNLSGMAAMTLDGGATWQEFSGLKHTFGCGDVDWNSPKPELLFADTIDPYSKSVSTDGGKTWTDLADSLKNFGHHIHVGVFDAKTLVIGRSEAGEVSVSRDFGVTWSKAAQFHALGIRPVHYGAKLYWASDKGVMTSENGSDWKLCGTELPNATWGPYFGKSEAEMMVVSEQGLFITLDAAKTWKKVAGFPTTLPNARFNLNARGMYFSWDPIHNLVYASVASGPVWRLQVK